MIKKPMIFAYGIKLIAMWMLIPFILMFIPALAREFAVNVTTQQVVLGEQTYSRYPDEVLYFNTDVNGKEREVSAPVTCKTGDTVTIVLRNGSYSHTPRDAKELAEHATFRGRFLKICNNNFGIHTAAIAVVFLLTFIVTFKKRKVLRAECPKLSIVTDIAGLACSVIMSASLLYAVMDNGLGALGIAYLSLFLGIAYTVIFIISWIIGSILE